MQSRCELTFEQVHQAGREAYWDGPDGVRVLEFDPSDGSVWVRAGFSAPEPTPAEGWYHEGPCNCEFCR